MHSLLASLLLIAIGGHPSFPSVERPAALESNSDWRYVGEAAHCELTSQGGVLALEGAAVELACSTPGSLLGNVQLQLPAKAWRQRRVTISADVKVSAGLSATLWLKSQQGLRTLMFDDDSELQLIGTENIAGKWQHREITVPVGSDATNLSLGLLVQSSNDEQLNQVELRNVRIVTSQPGPMSKEALAWLEAALSVVKQQTAARGDLSWQVLEPQVRVFASGAQSTADVYPAVRYLLAQLGGNNMLLSPELAAMLHSTTVDAPHVGFALPDGARVILAQEALQPAVDTRTARNMDAVSKEASPALSP